LRISAGMFVYYILMMWMSIGLKNINLFLILISPVLMYYRGMVTQIYKPTYFGQYNKQAALEVLDSLEKDGESRAYIELLISSIVAQNQGIREFGRESAREVIALAISSGYFTPRVWRKK